MGDKTVASVAVELVVFLSIDLLIIIAIKLASAETTQHVTCIDLRKLLALVDHIHLRIQADMQSDVGWSAFEGQGHILQWDGVGITL